MKNKRRGGNVSVVVDREKFNEELKARGLTQEGLSKKLGRGKTCIANYLFRDNKLPMYVVEYLEELYKLPKEKYVVDGIEEEPSYDEAWNDGWQEGFDAGVKAEKERLRAFLLAEMEK